MSKIFLKWGSEQGRKERISLYFSVLCGIKNTVLSPQQKVIEREGAEGKKEEPIESEN